MCLVSDKIKFCTCLTEDVQKLKNYWILYRFNPDKQIWALGLSMMPTSYRDPNFQINELTILTRLNESDSFDFDTDFHQNDKLQVVIGSGIINDFEFDYTFEFINGKWINCQSDPFELMNMFNEEQSGKLKHPVTIKKK